MPHLTVLKKMKKEITTVCPDFYDWPDRWMGVEADRVYGRKILQYFEL